MMNCSIVISKENIDEGKKIKKGGKKRGNYIQTYSKQNNTMDGIMWHGFSLCTLFTCEIAS